MSASQRPSSRDPRIPDLSACIAGDAAAWRFFVESTAGVIHAAVRKACERHSLPRQEVDDLVQETYVRLLRDDARLLRTFDATRASLATWLTLIARTIVHERSRRAASRPASHPLNEGDSTSAPAAETAPDLPWHALSRQQQEVLALLFQQGLTAEQAAARLEVDPQTIRSAKHKALQRLRDELSRLRGDESPTSRLSPESSPAPRSLRPESQRDADVTRPTPRP